MLARALVSPLLIGRDAELHLLVECRLAAARGHGSLVLVSGDAGIGKTRLLQTFRRSLRGGRAALGVGLCREFGTEPYGPIREGLRDLRADSAGVAPAASHEEQLAELRERLAHVCRRQTVALFVEDVHWADDATLRFLHHLLPSLRSMRLLIVATYRSDEARRVAQLEPYLARLVRDRSTDQIALKPLEPAQMRRLVELAAGTQRRLSHELIEGIVERSDGNPLFAEELLKNALAGSTGALPFTVRATVLERVAGLDVASRNVLALASVLGRRFSAEFLSTLSNIALDDLLRILRDLRNLQLIDELDNEPLRYAFRHALTREAVYGELLSAESRALHARILHVLEETGWRDAADLGYHAWAARDPSKATEYNERAGDEARALHAYGAATRSYRRALEFVHDAEHRSRLFVKAAQSCAHDGKSRQAVDLYESAIATLRGSGQRERLLHLYQEMGAQARLGGDNERAIEILADAMRTVPNSDPGEAAALALGIAHLRLDRGEVAAAADLIARSAAVADRLSYYKVLPYAALVAGDVAGWRAATAQALDFSHDVGPEHVAATRFNAAFGFTIFGLDEEAAEQFESLITHLHALRLSSLEVLACGNFALIHARRGRLSEARGLIERAAAIPSPSTTGPVVLAAAAFVVGNALWDEALVERFCSEAVVEMAFRSRINSTLGRIAGPYARWLHAQSDAAGAQAALRRAMEQLPAAFGATESFLAAAELGDEATRAAAFDRIADLEAMPAVPMYAVTAVHLKALRADRNGDVQNASRFAHEALVRYRDLGWPLHEAACLELLGERKRAAARYRKLHVPGTLRGLQSGQGHSPERGILSEREHQIASLVAKGSVNKHIADLLAVNQRTIEKHLTSIYGKLGIRNRSELAAFMARTTSSVATE